MKDYVLEWWKRCASRGCITLDQLPPNWTDHRSHYVLLLDAYLSYVWYCGTLSAEPVPLTLFGNLWNRGEDCTHVPMAALLQSVIEVPPLGEVRKKLKC